MYQNLHGRFTAVDPLLASGKSANPQTFNRYVYVMNNPLMFVDPDGLQVATASGRVFRRGNMLQIFNGRPERGWRRVTNTINTTTTIGGVKHHFEVRPNGWTVGGRVDGVTFEAPPPEAAPKPKSDISIVAREVVSGVKDGITGIAKGVGNAPAAALNGLTACLFNCGVQVAYFQFSNPLAVPMPFAYNNERETDYGSASSIGTLFGAGIAGGTIFGGSATTSVVPEHITGFAVTPEGVVLAQPKYAIPSHFVENSHRARSYGEIINGKFVERIRLDGPTQKYPNHYHWNKEKPHLYPGSSKGDPGF